MPRSTPPNTPVTLSRREILESLSRVDADDEALARVRELEAGFRERNETLCDNLPGGDSELRDLNTSPFVLMGQAFNEGYTAAAEIEKDLLLGKVFSYIETAAGRMWEDVVLPVYGWELTRSSMHTSYSVVDGERVNNGTAEFLTLKSGPRCLNDDSSRGIANDVASNCRQWATDKGVDHVTFTYGALYGTPKQSNKKDWHIIEKVEAALEDRGAEVLDPAYRSWNCSLAYDGLRLDLLVEHGIDLWQRIGGHEDAFTEICAALIRASVRPEGTISSTHDLRIADFRDVIGLSHVPEDYEVDLLDRNQLEWLFLLAAHFCDALEGG